MKNVQSTSFMNYQERAREFGVGDAVVPYYAREEFAGRVTAVYPAIGMVDVEFPYGNKRFPVEELTKLFSNRTRVETPLSDSVPAGAGTQAVPGGPEAPKVKNLPVQKVAQRVSQAYVKKALYWAQADRRYRANQEERSQSQFLCPKCDTPMKPAVYKRENGVSEKLYGCPKCLFLITRDSILEE